MSEKDLKHLITNIESDKLCYLMMSLDQEAQNRILNTMSGNAQKCLLDDINDIKKALQNRNYSKQPNKANAADAKNRAAD